MTAISDGLGHGHVIDLLRRVEKGSEIWIDFKATESDKLHAWHGPELKV